MAALFDREALPHLDALRHFALKLCRNEQFSNDLVQETMLKACKSFGAYREGTNCRAWLFQICKNSYINEYRRKNYETIPMDFSGTSQNSGEDDTRHNLDALLIDNSSTEAHDAMVGDEVATALHALPVDYQSALIMSDIEGMTYEEIADFFQAPIGTIRSRIHRGRKILAERLRGYAQERGLIPANAKRCSLSRN